ncbi:hypothetical protein [Phyllobacterium sp. K27]
MTIKTFAEAHVVTALRRSGLNCARLLTAIHPHTLRFPQRFTWFPSVDMGFRTAWTTVHWWPQPHDMEPRANKFCDHRFVKSVWPLQRVAEKLK